MLRTPCNARSRLSCFADILKQQGHFHDMNALAYSTDGSLVVTGGGDGKVTPLDAMVAGVTRRRP
jgi:hypothetical protein